MITVSPIADVFARCAAENRAALIVYLMAGDPSLDHTPALLAAAAAGGADIVELGIPYSDPLADGPTIQAAAQRALKSGTTFDGVLELVAKLDRSSVPVPIIAFGYFNPVYVRGLTRTARDLKDAGFSGAILPDLPPEEAEEAHAALRAAGISLTMLVAPTTPLERTRAIGDASDDFVYVVSRMGVTGETAQLGTEVRDLVERVRPVVSKPLAVGFGVSTPEHAHAIAAYADGVVVGSALIAQAGGSPDVVRSFCASLRSACART